MRVKEVRVLVQPDPRFSLVPGEHEVPSRGTWQEVLRSSVMFGVCNRIFSALLRMSKLLEMVRVILITRCVLK